MQEVQQPTTSVARAVLPPAVCVIGLGLIGGSLARATRELVPTYGWSPSEETRDAATADGFDVDGDLVSALSRATEQDALIVLAAPLPAINGLLRVIGTVAPTVRLTDVASVKTPVADAVAEFAPQTRYVGSHPMAGTAASGWPAGSATLFDGAAWVTCLTEETPLADWTSVAGLALAVGSRVVPTEAEAHDQAVARISHLPHLLALGLAQVGLQGGALALSLAASSFADGTRVAGTRPALIRAMCEANRDALIDALDDALGILGVARGSLASTGSLQKITTAGHAARTEFDARGANLSTVTLGGDDLVDQLLAVGAAGGHVSGIDQDENGLSVSAWYPDGE